MYHAISGPLFLVQWDVQEESGVLDIIFHPENMFLKSVRSCFLLISFFPFVLSCDRPDDAIKLKSPVRGTVAAEDSRSLVIYFVMPRPPIWNINYILSVVTNFLPYA